jgi:hypothetical protein
MSPEEDAKRLIDAFDVLRTGGDDEPFWRLHAEIVQNMPAWMQYDLNRRFLEHLEAILKVLETQEHEPKTTSKRQPKRQ